MQHQNILDIAPHAHPGIFWSLFISSLLLHVAVPVSSVDAVSHWIIMAVQLVTGILAGMASWGAYKHYKRENAREDRAKDRAEDKQDIEEENKK